MEKAREYITSNALSFTVLVLIFAVADILNIGITPSITSEIVLLFFLITSTIMVLMFLTDRFVEHNILLMMFVHIVEIEASVFFWGMFVFELVPGEISYVLTTLAIGVLVYIPVIAFFLIKGKTEETKINKVIEVRKKGAKNGKDN